jgi:hypothetical protein
MGILGLLVMLLMPAVNFGIQAAQSAATLHTISQIEAGLAAFHGDFGTYPPSDSESEFSSSAKTTGYENLAFFLCQPWGGGGPMPGGGTSEKRYGPYLETEDLTTEGVLDAFRPKQHILYFRYKPAEDPAYDVEDNPVDDEAVEGFPSKNNFKLLVLRSGSNQYVRTDYVLISAGPDRTFGYRTGPDGETAATDYDNAYCDDVTNFQYE